MKKSLLSAVAVAAMVAFSGNACNGAVGGFVVCDNSCVPFSGRQSFIVPAPSFARPF